MSTKRFGDLLREHRLRRGFSQEGLAEKARISPEAIGTLERGTRRAPYRSTVVQLSAALELDEAQSLELEEAASRARARAQAGAVREQQATNNLPAQMSSFVGREEDVETVRALIDEYRHVTLTGVGGIGKTRIALNAAIDLLDAFEGTWFIDLTPFNDASLVPIAILSALNVPESPRRTPLQTIITFLKDKHVLLLFDNCEHVIDSAATAIQEILLHCPRVHILATSRELLGIPGEKTVRVSTLSVPALETAAGLTVDDALGYGAVVLFVDRAREADSRFEFTQPLVATIVEICYRLDGIALAIELAAARVNVLSVGVLARKLDEHFLISLGGKRTAPPRHRTMRALLDWSYELLDEREQRILRNLSVFAGGFTLELAADLFTNDESIEESSMLDLLGSLVDKSLLQFDSRSGASRYRLLEPTRQYAREKQRQQGEGDRAARAHALAMLALVDRFASWAFISDARWKAQVQFEHENWLAALQWAFGAGGDVLIGQRLAGEFINVLYAIESSAEDMRWVRRAIDSCDESTPPSVRAKLEVAQVICSLPLGRLLTAQTTAAAERALRLFEAAGDPLGGAVAQTFIGEGLIYKQSIAEGESLLRTALATAQAGGAQRLVAYITRTLSIARALAGDLDAARALMRVVLEMYEAAGCARQQAMLRVSLAEYEFRAGNAQTALDATVATIDSTREYKLLYYLTLTLNNAAAYAIALSRFEEGRGYAREALLLASGAGFSLQFAWASQHLAAIAALWRLDPERAARLLGFTDALFSELETSRRYTEQQEYDKILTLLSREIGRALDDLLREGAEWSAEHALEELLKI
ncbi:MAG TPA: helix-turn-helix domain-containing protein [Verrucomicrobiae bacterium]|nr:helix-turn-helix domain-containing protein [Verrucomicrobiae bacterium]